MKAVLIEGYMEKGVFATPFSHAGKRIYTYPLPPFSTVAGMVHFLCRWDCWHDMNISIAGSGTMNEQEFAMRWKGGAYAGSETDEFKKRFPVRVKNGTGFTGWVNTPIFVDFVADLNLRLHIQPKNEKEVDIIYKMLKYPRRFPNLGRHEDLLRIDKVEVVDILPPEKITLDLSAYAPVFPGISGTVYALHKKYTVNRDRRIFEDVKTVYLDAGQEVTTEIDSCGNPEFLM